MDEPKAEQSLTLFTALVDLTEIVNKIENQVFGDHPRGEKEGKLLAGDKVTIARNTIQEITGRLISISGGLMNLGE